jgi:hypothetical protein
MPSCTLPDAKMLSAWISVEHYRLHTVESWPESAFKQAALRAIHSALASLGQNGSPRKGSWECAVCAVRSGTRFATA